jgi:hypothetical protein
MPTPTGTPTYTPTPTQTPTLPWQATPTGTLVPASTLAPTPTPTGTPTYTPTQAPTLPWQATPTGTPLPTSTFVPTPTPTPTPIPTIVKPELLEPLPGVTCRNPVTFKWSGSLAPGLVHQVTAQHLASGYVIQSERLLMDSWTVELPAERYGEWRWWVAVVSNQGVVAASVEWVFWFDPFPKTPTLPQPPTPTSTYIPLPTTPTLSPLPTPTSTYIQ